MPDIFISYSRKDAEHATMLAEMLASAGLSCWIDQSGIEAAASWSAQIVDAINDCRVFVALLSPSSIESHNVIKEISLASEKRKRILPLDLEPVTLPRELEYQLAGIQRAPMTNIDAIIRALAKLGLEATSAPQAPKIVKEQSEKKSLMILPFEDLSPTVDNGWFADGIVSELIQALSNIKSLIVADAQATKEFKSYKGQLSVYAREMVIRYFVQGDVRKFGDNIKINVRLLDIETGDNLWQDSIKGTMADVFEIQEQVAQKVVDGLKLHLTSDEKKKLAERGTENAEAYELCLKAKEYYERQTKEGFRITAQLSTEAIQLDPKYAKAYESKANALVALYSGYERDPDLLREAETLCNEALRIEPTMLGVYHPLSLISMHQGNLEKAEALAKEVVRKKPDNYNGHFTLGFLYGEIGQPAKAVASYEEAARLKPDYRPNLFNLVVSCYVAQELEKCKQWSLVALPLYERQLKLQPDDENTRVGYAILLLYSGRVADAGRQAIILRNVQDGGQLYNVACLLAAVGEKEEATATFRKSIEAGFKKIRRLKEFLVDEKEGILSLQGTPEYEEVKRMVGQIVAESEAKENA
jgi:adenylate cyclase